MKNNVLGRGKNQTDVCWKWEQVVRLVVWSSQYDLKEAVIWTASQSFLVLGNRTCQWCRYSCSVMCAIKFEVSSFPLWKMWPINHMSIIRHGDLHLWPFDLGTGWFSVTATVSFLGFLPDNYSQNATPFHTLLRARHGTDRQTNGQPKRQLPPTNDATSTLCRLEHNNAVIWTI